MRYLWTVAVTCAIPSLLTAQGVPSVTRTSPDGTMSSSALQYRFVRGTFESSYITGLSGFGNHQDQLLFEGTVAPHYSFAVWRLAFVGTPKIVLRMLDEHSAPVRRPSYMPRVSAYYWMRPTSVRSRIGFYYAHATLLSHHSNGQDGAFYVPGTDSLNTRDGSFSLNYSDLSVGWIGMDSVGGPYGTARFGIRVNWPFNESEPLRDSIDDKYGTYRFVAAGSGTAAHNWLRATFAWDLQYVLDENFRHIGFFADERLTTSLSLLWSLNSMDDVGVLVSFFRGQDYYNMSYKHRFWALRAGLAFNATSTFLSPR